MLWRRWVVLIGFGIGGVLLGLGVAGATPTMYQADSLLVVVPTGSATSDLAVGYARVFGSLADNKAVLTSMITNDPNLGNVEEVAKSISVDVSPNTPMFDLMARDSDPEAAAALANKVAQAVSDYTAQSQERTGYRAEILTVAIPPDEPTSPNAPLNALVGGAIGLLVAGLLILGIGPMSAYELDEGIADVESDMDPGERY